MTDRELLELAAGAARLLFDPTVCHAEGLLVVRPDVHCQSDQVLWYPLTDDGNALRLAVKLHMQISTLHTGVDGSRRCGAFVPGFDGPGASESGVVDPLAATRRAIVCAAAEIGKVAAA